MLFDLMPGEEPVAQFGEVNLTTHRVIGPAAGDDKGRAAILLVDVTFCGVSSKTPHHLIGGLALVLILAGVFGFGMNHSEVGGWVLPLGVGVILLIWFSMQRSTVLSVRSAGGAIEVNVSGRNSADKADELVNQIGPGKIRQLMKYTHTCNVGMRRFGA